MALTQTAEYALRAVVWLAQHPGEPQTKTQIADATQVASHDTRPKPRPAFVYESWRMYFEKRHGRAYALATALLKLPAVWLGVTLARLRRHRSPVPVRFTRDHWRHVVRPLIWSAASR